jgi:hypothetical protein
MRQNGLIDFAITISGSEGADFEIAAIAATVGYAINQPGFGPFA